MKVYGLVTNVILIYFSKAFPINSDLRSFVSVVLCLPINFTPPLTSLMIIGISSQGKIPLPSSFQIIIVSDSTVFYYSFSKCSVPRCDCKEAHDQLSRLSAVSGYWQTTNVHWWCCDSYGWLWVDPPLRIRKRKRSPQALDGYTAQRWPWLKVRDGYLFNHSHRQLQIFTILNSSEQNNDDTLSKWRHQHPSRTGRSKETVWRPHQLRYSLHYVLYFTSSSIRQGFRIIYFF